MTDEIQDEQVLNHKFCNFQSGSEGGYQQYNQLSPNRSPSGPTYTQLSGGPPRPPPGVNVNVPGQTYHPPTTSQGLFHLEKIFAKLHLK